MSNTVPKTYHLQMRVKTIDRWMKGDRGMERGLFDDLWIREL